MKYFTLELLDKASNLLDLEYEVYDKMWMDNLTAYWEQFENYKHRLPKRFVQQYCKHAFHDYNIESISFFNDVSKRKDCYSVELTISFDNNRFSIKYIGVQKYRITANKLCYYPECILLYSEILPLDDKLMSHEIIFEDRNIIYMEFKKIIFKKL